MKSLPSDDTLIRPSGTFSPRGEGSTHWFSVIEIALPLLLEGIPIVESYDVLKLMMPWAQTIPSVDESEEFVRQATANWILKKNEEPYLNLWIFRRDTMQFIGGTGLHHMNWDIPTFESGYWLHAKHHNQGFATEAINALTQYVFQALQAMRLEIRCDINNIRSKKIPERLGFELEATLKKNRLNPQTKIPSDTLVYARFNADNLPNLSVTWGAST